MKLSIGIILSLSTSLHASTSLENLGERLFKDMRFSQYFAMASQGDVNLKLKLGSSELETIEISGTQVVSPFKGEAMSCASCHMLDQAAEVPSAGMRGYNDFAKLTLIPKRGDLKTHTLRNTPSLIGIGSKYARNRISHYDGEFFDHSETVLGNFTGRNMGWLASEKNIALKNIVRVLKGDDGSSVLADEFGSLSYRDAFLGQDATLPDDIRIPPKYRFDIDKVSDEYIISKVIFFVTFYLDSLDFSTDEKGHYNGSPYDEFLKINNIPRGPAKEQSMGMYLAELIGGVKDLENPKFVKTRFFPTHKKNFKFGEEEFKGLKLFFNLSKRSMCINCHLPPLFTDHLFHNTGATQLEYDQIHGEDTFSALKIPKLENRDESIYFLSRPSEGNKKLVDLGLWNFFARPQKMQQTDYIRTLFCRRNKSCINKDLLDNLIGRFKTVSLRNLAHSAPYFHNGSSDNLEKVVEQYLEASKLIKENRLRNGAHQLKMSTISAEDISPLVKFMKSLNEDYE